MMNQLGALGNNVLGTSGSTAGTLFNGGGLSTIGIPATSGSVAGTGILGNVFGAPQGTNGNMNGFTSGNGMMTTNGSNGSDAMSLLLGGAIIQLPPTTTLCSQGITRPGRITVGDKSADIQVCYGFGNVQQPPQPLPQQLQQMQQPMMMQQQPQMMMQPGTTVATSRSYHGGCPCR